MVFSATEWALGRIREAYVNISVCAGQSLLVAEGFDGIAVGALAGGEDPEDQADQPVKFDQLIIDIYLPVEQYGRIEDD